MVSRSSKHKLENYQEHPDGQLCCSIVRNLFRCIVFRPKQDIGLSSMARQKQAPIKETIFSAVGELWTGMSGVMCNMTIQWTQQDWLGRFIQIRLVSERCRVRSTCTQNIDPPNNRNDPQWLSLGQLKVFCAMCPRQDKLTDHFTRRKMLVVPRLAWLQLKPERSFGKEPHPFPRGESRASHC